MAKKGEIILEVRAEELGLQMDKLAEESEYQMKQAIGDIANAAHAMIIAKAQAELHTTRLDYLKHLTFERLDEDTYLINLDGDYANKLEAGYAAFDMKPGMLASKKIVEVGSRAGKPWVQKAEDGHRYAYVPLERQPFSKAPQARDMADAIKQLTAFNREGREQKITKLFKDPNGKVLEGAVAVARNTGIKDLEGLVKYQKTYTNEKTGKQTTQSIYINYRVVSEAAGSAEWKHPGFPGLKAFEDAERFVETEIDNILKHFLE